MSIIHRVQWATLRLNTGISSTGAINFTPHGGTARDAAYLSIGKTDTVKVYHNGTRNVLAANTAWLNAGVVIDRMGTVAGGVNYTNYFDASGDIIAYADYNITTASINAVSFAPLIGFHLTAGGTNVLMMALSFYSSVYHIDLFAKRWTGGNISTDATTVAKASLENKRIRFQLRMRPGVMDAGATTVASDGELIASMIDLDTLVETIFYTYTNTPLWYTYQGLALGGGETVPENNHLAVASIGFAGLVGENEQFVIQDTAIALPPAGSLIDESEACCSTTPGSASATPGPVLPPVSADWTASCAGGGTVATADEILDPEDWTVGNPPKEPDSWLTIETDPYPTVSPTDAEQVHWGLKPLSDRGRFVEARLKEVGRIERGSSDKDGRYPPARARFVADDADGRVRTWLADARQRFLYNREAGYHVASYPARKANLAAIPAIQGRLVDIDTELDRESIVEVQDIVGAHFGPLNPEKLIGRLIGDEHSNLPEASKGKIYGIAFGEFSTRGRVDAAGNSANYGAWPVVDCGDSDFESSPSGSIVYVSPPQNLTATKIGSATGNRENHYGIVGLTNFGHTLMSNVVSVANLPDSLDATDYVELEWDPPATGAEFIIAYWVMGRSANPPVKRLDTMNNGGTFVNPETIYRDGKQGTRTDFDSEKNVNWQPIATAPASNSVWTWFAVAIGEVEILDVCGSDLAKDTTPKRVVLDINGGDILTPASDDWPESEPYRVVGGIRQTGFWARGNRVQHHRDGVVTFAVNICGYKGINGELINQVWLQLQTFLNEFVEQDYADGAFGAIATFANGVPKLWTSKFQAAQDQTIEWMGGSPALGFIGRLYIVGQKTSLADVLRKFFTDYGGHLTSHRSGSIYPYYVNPSQDPAAGQVFRERMEIAQLLELETAWQELENRGKYSYLFNCASEAFEVTDAPFESAVSIAAHGGAPIGVFEDPHTKECFFGNDAATMAYRWATLHLALYAFAPRYVRWATNMEHFQKNNGDPARFTHRKEGIGATGETATPGVIQQTVLIVKDDAPKYEIQHRVRLLEPAGSP